VVTTLARCDWIRNVHLLLTGATGLGKTRTAFAFMLHACWRRFSALHARPARLPEALRIGARGDGSFSRRLARLARRVRHFFMYVSTFDAIESAVWRDKARIVGVGRRMASKSEMFGSTLLIGGVGTWGRFFSVAA
jgi:hypothetical protein